MAPAVAAQRYRAHRGDAEMITLAPCLAAAIYYTADMVRAMPDDRLTGSDALKGLRE